MVIPWTIESLHKKGRNKKMNFKELRQQSGMTQKQFADYFNIPKRTIENWEAGVNKCPEYLLDLMKYKLIHENIL